MVAGSGEIARRPRTRRMTSEARLAQIVDVATTLIAERGYWGLTLRDVAFACGLTEAGLLHHVETKDKLLLAVLEHRDGADLAALEAATGVTIGQIRGTEPLTIGLAELTAAFVDHNAGQPQIVRLYSVLDAEALEPSHPAYEFFAHREKRVLSAFARAGAGHRDPQWLARATLAAMDGLQLVWLRNPTVIDLRADWAAIIDRLMR